jgi:hypothetical protein
MKLVGSNVPYSDNKIQPNLSNNDIDILSMEEFGVIPAKENLTRSEKIDISDLPELIELDDSDVEIKSNELNKLDKNNNNDENTIRLVNPIPACPISDEHYDALSKVHNSRVGHTKKTLFILHPSR